jgi:hypothetical protein
LRLRDFSTRRQAQTSHKGLAESLRSRAPQNQNREVQSLSLVEVRVCDTYQWTRRLARLPWRSSRRRGRYPPTHHRKESAFEVADVLHSGDRIRDGGVHAQQWPSRGRGGADSVGWPSLVVGLERAFENLTRMSRRGKVCYLRRGAPDGGRMTEQGGTRQQQIWWRTAGDGWWRMDNGGIFEAGGWWRTTGGIGEGRQAPACGG